VKFQSSNIQSHKLNFLTWVTPSYLPTLSAEGPLMVLYRADRLQLQFGYDQGVPREPPSPPPDFVAGIRRFLKSFNRELSANYGGERIIPSSFRKAVFTPENRVYWARNLQSFQNFVRTPAVVSSTEPITKRDLTLRSFKPGKDPNWRGPQSCWVKGAVVPFDVINAIPIQKIRPADRLTAPTPSRTITKDKRKARTPPQLGPAPKRPRVRCLSSLLPLFF
jgi:hypothetical protein